MHIVGTDLCRRLDIEGEIDTEETAILIKAYFCFWRMTLLSSFAFEPNTLGGSFACCLLYIWRFDIFMSVSRCTTQVYHRVWLYLRLFSLLFASDVRCLV